MIRRLCFEPPGPPFHVVLVEPEIPQNTGNVARLTAATKSKLQLCGKLGFRIDEHAVRRAGLDYWHLVDVTHHASFEAFRETVRPPRLVALSAKAERSYLDFSFCPGDALVFGKESVGLDDALVASLEPHVLGIPTATDTVRSLNLGNAVSIVLYEALRQVGAFGGARAVPSAT
jgi:tRNA (cytidine/uridine-2'-O-)-methyltransferase